MEIKFGEIELASPESIRRGYTRRILEQNKRSILDVFWDMCNVF